MTSQAGADCNMINPLRIGELELATNLVLAPMAGYCDLPFRLVVRRCGGVGLGFTPLLSPKGVMYGTERTRELAATCVGDSPLALQFYGGNADELCEAARWAEDRGADVVDINMGCSVPKVVRNNGGSRLLCDPDGAVRIAEKMMTALRNTPLTAKLRLGWDETEIVAPRLAARLEEVGVAAVTVHGRTAAMKFSGRSRLDGIAAVVAAVRAIPIIGNGDVRSPQDAERMMKETGCRGVMIGRGALSAPWVFRDTWSYLTTGVVPPPPTIEEKCRLMCEHFENSVRFCGEQRTVLQFRKSASWYAKQMHPCRMIKECMPRIKSAAEFHDVMARFLEWRSRWDEDAARAAGTGAS